MAESRSLVRRIKGALLLIGILVLGSVIALFVIHRQKIQSGRSGDTTISDKKATISLEGVHHSATTNGVKEWSLQAESADYRLEERVAIFRTLYVTFFREEGDDIYLSAPSGNWHTESNDLDVTGHVVIKNRQHELLSDKLTYIHNSRQCVTDSPVTIKSEAFKITADTMRYDLDRNIIHLDGNAAGIIDEDIGL